jgi:hypothetical protein
MSISPNCGRVAQLGEHLLCKQGVAGSIPATSTICPEMNRSVIWPPTNVTEMGTFENN